MRSALPASPAGLAAALLLAVASTASTAHAAATLPPGFVEEPAPFTFTQPTNLRFLPDGRYLVTEKAGRLWLVDGATRRQLWANELAVLNSYDRGLLAVEIDRDYPASRWVYLLYSVDPDSNNVESNEDNWGRLERFQMAANERSLVAGTRQVLFGTTWADGPLMASASHSIGGLAWGRDGSLLVTAGDGAHYGYLDPGGFDADIFLPGRANPDEDIGAFRSRMVSSMTGKLLRLDPETGHGLPSNPYWDGIGNSRASRVFASGLRNAFRLCVRPGTGSLDPGDGDPGVVYYGDVGWETWEEFGAVRFGGAYMGWPCYEGEHAQAQYMAATPTHDGCGEPSSPAVMPLLTFHHYQPELSSPPGVSASCAVGGVFYQGASYPAGYYGGWFIADYVESWIRVLKVDPQDQAVELLEFGSNADNPVAFDRDPVTGDIWYVSISTGQVRRIRYNSTVAVGPGGAPAAAIRLAPPAPNPARGAARFALTLPREAAVDFAIVDAMGREVWRETGRVHPAGPSTLHWEGRDARGERVASGVYFARVNAAGERAVTRFALLR